MSDYIKNKNKITVLQGQVKPRTHDPPQEVAVTVAVSPPEPEVEVSEDEAAAVVDSEEEEAEEDSEEDDDSVVDDDSEEEDELLVGTPIGPSSVVIDAAAEVAEA